jgi:hypothetical protein
MTRWLKTAFTYLGEGIALCLIVALSFWGAVILQAVAGR